MTSIKVKSLQEAQAYLQLTLDGQAEAIPTPKAPRNNEEQQTQIALFAKRRVLQATYPELRFLYATLNGIYIPPALLRQVADAGLTKGVLDLRLDVPHVEASGRHWAGLCLDLKAKTGKPTPEQLDWAAQLATCGIRAGFAMGDAKQGYSALQDAWWTIASYLGLSGDDHYQAYLTQEQKYALASLLASERLAKSTVQAEKEARRLAKALAPPPIQTKAGPRKSKAKGDSG